MNFDQMYESVENARIVLNRAKEFIQKMAKLIVMDGNMKKVSSSTLDEMKKQLRNWDMVKKQWKN